VDETDADLADPEFSALAEKLHWSMFRIAAAFRRQEYARVKGAELTLTQCSILYRLRDRGPLLVSELAAIENVTGATMTIAVSRLEQMGMVTRRRDSSDKRLIWIDLTPPGRAAPRAAVGHMVHAMRRELSAEDLTALLAAIGPLQRLARISDADQGRSR
jgi:DNA-binding MarR family transcriptional regulator